MDVGMELPGQLCEPAYCDDYQARQTGTLKFCYKCPLTNPDGTPCGIWKSQNRGSIGAAYVNIERHFTGDHRGEVYRRPSVDKLETRWVQQISVAKSLPPVFHSFVLPEDWTPARLTRDSQLPPAPIFSTPDLTPVNHSADWMHKLGWVEYRESLGQFSLIRLQSLVELPSKSLSARMKGADEWVEMVLLTLHAEILGYLLDANDYVHERHASVAAAVVNG
jgi:hypothetical protein